MKTCIVCGAPARGPRCKPHEKQHQAQRNRSEARRPYFDPAYERAKKALLAGNPVCALCSQPGADTLDHIKPLSQGGRNHIDNLQPAHRACNSKKGTS